MVTTELIRDPQKRKERAQEKEQQVLRFLRKEIYSSTAILSYEMKVGVRAARNVLNRMEQKGLLIKDEVRFMGSKALPLWGITSTGIMHDINPDYMHVVSLRYHRAGRISPLTIEHTLDIQRCRQYHTYIVYCYEWTPTRLLPGHNEKRNSPKRWSVYPDAVVRNESFDDDEMNSAIEVERSRKTPARYVQLIRGHLRNIKDNRYNEVLYYCPTQKMADSLSMLFRRLIHQHQITLYVAPHQQYNSDECLAFFHFNSMEHFR